MKYLLFIILFAFVPVLSPTIYKITAYDLDSIMKIVETKYNAVYDYQCTFSKKEWIDGDYVSWTNIIYKYRKPNNYYLKWTEGTWNGTHLFWKKI
jgi:hypothetical protein